MKITGLMRGRRSLLIFIMATCMLAGLEAQVGMASNPARPPGETTGCQNFSDVDVLYYGSDVINYWACNNAVSGYTSPECSNNGVASPCFLPNKPMTRAAYMKMIVHGFGWAYNTSGGPHFTDVSTSHPHYLWIETAYNRGLISGYTGAQCTGASPPAASPCFLPYYNMTRGQMAKVTALAAGFNDSVSGRIPTFADVPSTDTFFQFIERLVMHGTNVRYPPNMPPYCSSTTQPCYFPYTAAPRADGVAHMDRVAEYFDHGQVLAMTEGDLVESQTYIRTPDPLTAAGNRKAVPAGLGTQVNIRFIESGPLKICNPFCSLRPYGSWGSYDTADFQPSSSMTLEANGWYWYRAMHVSGNTYKSQFCDAYGCYDMITSGDLRQFPLYVAFAGIETIPESAGMGTVNIGNALIRLSGYSYFVGWCPDRTIAPKKKFNGYMGPCNNSAWDMSY